MTKLKFGVISDDKPIKLTVEMAAEVHRDLLDYAEILGSQTGHPIAPEKLISHMLARFMATDRGFAKARKTLRDHDGQAGPNPRA